jgi:hypothetical protein
MKNKLFFIGEFCLFLFALNAQATQISALNSRQFNKYWSVESESPNYKITFCGGDTIEIFSPKGLTLWRKEKMSGDTSIEYDACVMDEGKQCDRLSDLNCFWMASDPQYPNDLWKRKNWRNGIFANYYSLKLYYLGYGGNNNSTTRFRCYNGDERGIKDKSFQPAILREYTDSEHLLKPNHWYHIKIVSRGNKISYYMDGKRLVDFRDVNSLTSGWFGFRTTLSRTRITNFRYSCTQLEKEPVCLKWVGEVPSVSMPVSFGVPFAQGSLIEGRQVNLVTPNGQSLPTDMWPLAYWPDGSIKWGGFAAVVPASTDQLKLDIGTIKKKQTAAMEIINNESSLQINTGVVRAIFPKTGEYLLDGLWYRDVQVGGRASLICKTQDHPLSEDAEQIRFQSYKSEIKKVEVEHVGSVRVVIKVEGVHKANGREWLPFTIRFYFYKGSDQIKMVHTFVYDGDQYKDFIQSLGVRFEVPMREALYNRHIAFSGAEGGVWSEPVQPLVGRRTLTLNGDLTLQEQQMEGKRIPSYDKFDAENRSLLDHWASWDGFRLSQLNADAFSIRKRATDDNPWIGTFSGNRSDGYVFAGDVSGGLGVYLHDFWQSCPATIEVDNARKDTATLTMWLWSSDAEAMDLRHYDKVAHDLNASYEDVQEGLSTPYGIARTHTLTIVPQPAYPGKAGIAKMAKVLTTNSPLMCSPEYLHQQQAFGVWSLPDYSTSFRTKIEERLNAYIDFYRNAIEQNKWYGFWNYGDVMHAYDPVRHEWRYDVGGFAWDNTELGSNMWLWYNFLRTGRSDIWKMAEAMTRHTAEVDVYHIGENAGLGSRHNVSHWGCGAKEARISQAAWNRFYYYLTTDDRCGDLMREVKDAEQKLYTLDPMRLAEPRSLYPCTAPARLRIGPDWLAYVGNWMTEWERTRNTVYRDKILAGMKSIASLKHGLFTGPKALGFDPATGIITYEGDSIMQNTNHLMTIMGGFEIMNELQRMVDVPAWNKVWLDHAANYKKKAIEISNNHFRISKLLAYAAYYAQRKDWAKEAWNDLLRWGKNGTLPPFTTSRIQPPEVPAPIDENSSVSTNDAAHWSLDAIYMLETCPYDE